ncbi:YncE family protein [Luteimonas sp. Y-2-2-4F]|nr:YncE family protein [Luteimonas sp. Y-2-2-4F]MCD9030679.1 YncE family protein [Luteimonas sp. Y-2-2-4F]
MRTSFRSLSLLAAALLALVLPLQASAQALAPQAAPDTAVQNGPDGVQRRELARGVYEARYSRAANALFVASSEAVPNVKGGALYRLDPQTLETTGLTHTDGRNFGLAVDADGATLYATNSVDSGITAFDAATGEVKGRLRFEERASDGSRYGPRQVIHDPATGTLYVGGVGDPGVIWVVDAATLTLRTTIQNAGKWVTGLLLDRDAGRLYAANGDGEVLVIDTATHAISQRWKPGGDEEALLLNLALDPGTHRLFVTDHSKLKTVLVLDSRDGRVRQRLPVGDSMGILLNPVRGELYVTHRDQGTLSVLDAGDYRVLRTIALPPNPNSLELDPTGQVLYVTVKTPFNKDYSASGFESVVRIALD